MKDYIKVYDHAQELGSIIFSTPYNFISTLNVGLQIGVTLLGCLLPLLLPLLHWCCVVCQRSTKKYELMMKLVDMSDGSESEFSTCARICSMHFYIGKWACIVYFGSALAPIVFFRMLTHNRINLFRT